MIHPPPALNIPFPRAETAVQCIFARQLTGPRTILSTAVTKKKSHRDFSQSKTFDTTPENIEVASLLTVKP